MSKPFNLPALRGKLGLDQAQMAERMGFDARHFLELETSPEKVQPGHAMLAHLVSLDVAIERRQPNLVSTSMREKIVAWHRLQMAQASKASSEC